mmetsp:Transcript_707/g.2917  ORF Transcript_707/g.2917 Transcript_707/m.2917 type:complete len:324 (+) Transcript_707:1203-2174(+)
MDRGDGPEEWKRKSSARRWRLRGWSLRQWRTGPNDLSRPISIRSAVWSGPPPPLATAAPLVRPGPPPSQQPPWASSRGAHGRRRQGPRELPGGGCRHRRRLPRLRCTRPVGPQVAVPATWPQWQACLQWRPRGACRREWVGERLQVAAEALRKWISLPPCLAHLRPVQRLGLEQLAPPREVADPLQLWQRCRGKGQRCFQQASRQRTPSPATAHSASERCLVLALTYTGSSRVAEVWFSSGIVLCRGWLASGQQLLSGSLGEIRLPLGPSLCFVACIRLLFFLHAGSARRSRRAACMSFEFLVGTCACMWCGSWIIGDVAKAL